MAPTAVASITQPSQKQDDEEDKSSQVTGDEEPFHAIAGLETAKAALREAIILPQKFPQYFEGPHRSSWKAILL